MKDIKENVYNKVPFLVYLTILPGRLLNNRSNLLSSAQSG